MLELTGLNVQTIGGFCALLGVFILALPVPIVVNRYLTIFYSVLNHTYICKVSLGYCF